NYLKLAPEDWWNLYQDSELVRSGSNFFGKSASEISVLPDVSVINGIIMLPKDVAHETNLAYMDKSTVENADHIAFDMPGNLPQHAISVVSNDSIAKSTHVDNLGSRMNSTDAESSEFTRFVKENEGEDDGDTMAQVQQTLVNSRQT